MIVFGDATRGVVRNIAAQFVADSGEIFQHHRVMLAPHHGTRAANPHFCARHCISQGGARMYPHWRHVNGRHLNCGRCLHTHSGDIVTWLR